MEESFPSRTPSHSTRRAGHVQGTRGQGSARRVEGYTRTLHTLAVSSPTLSARSSNDQRNRAERSDIRLTKPFPQRLTLPSPRPAEHQLAPRDAYNYSFYTRAYCRALGKKFLQNDKAAKGNTEEDKSNSAKTPRDEIVAGGAEHTFENEVKELNSHALVYTRVRLQKTIKHVREKWK